MADAIKVTVNVKPAFDDIISRYNFTPRQVQQIGSSAINRSLTTVRARVVKRLGADINMRLRDIRDLVKINRATTSTLAGDVTVERKLIPLIDFVGTRQTPTGVSVLVRKDGPRKVFRGTFIARMGSGHMGVYERGTHLPTQGPNVGKTSITGRLIPGRLYRSVGRLVIFERFGLTLTGYLSHAPQVVAEEEAAAGDVLQKNILSQIQRLISRK